MIPAASGSSQTFFVLLRGGDFIKGRGWGEAQLVLDGRLAPVVVPVAVGRNKSSFRRLSFRGVRMAGLQSVAQESRRSSEPGR